MITKTDISSLNLSPTKKDFVQIWNELIEVASKITERWDPTSTNESDPGIVLLKVLAGIADKLNYNIDKNILEAYMPTAAQIESMRKLCEMVGYDIKYYQSAETVARISYTGNTTDKDSEEYLPATGLAVTKFTTLTNADKDITFVTTNTVPMLITNDAPWVEVPCIEGQISQCESTNEYNLITLAQLDDNNRYYLPEIQIAENGIFVFNAAATANGYTDGILWDQVSNLNTKATELRVYKFGYDSFEGRPYLAFPDDIGSLIGDGLFIYFVRTSGLSGNISPRTLEVLEVPADKDWENYSAELFEVVNVDATTNGANIESISAAYNNFKKTVGTFDTLVTCRDYMNKIYSLMNASNSPYVSNILVTDIRNDINSAITLCSCNEFGILYKETPLTEIDIVTSKTRTSTMRVDHFTEDDKTINKLVIDNSTPVEIETEVPLIDHFDLRLYPFKTFTQVSSSTKDLVTPYNKSFTYTEQMNREIDAALADFKTCAHNLTTPVEGDIVAINNYLRLNALIATSTKVSEIEATTILNNVKAALVNEFNLRNLDFGEEIPFDTILAVIENADSRIKAVSLQEPTVLTTYSVKELVGDTASSVEYGIASTEATKISGVNYSDGETKKGETARDIYNKLVLRNILAGRASLLEYDETFIPNNSEKPYTITRNISDDFTSEQINTVANQIVPKDEAGNMVPGEYIANILKEYNEPDMLPDSTEDPVSNSTITLKVFDDQTVKVYETAAPDLIKPMNESDEVIKSNIITDITRIEAICELTGDGEGTFKNVTLGKNEVIKFRAPNLITTKTFPAYVYYRFERAGAGVARGNNSQSSEGRYATAISLNSFIGNAIGETEFFGGYSVVNNERTEAASTSEIKGLWQIDEVKKNLKSFTATLKKDADGNVIQDYSEMNQANLLSNIFETSIAVGVIDKEIVTDVFVNTTGLNAYLAAKASEAANNTELTITFSYYPLTNGTLAAWSDYISKCYTEKSNGLYLPGTEKTARSTTPILWRLSSTSSHPMGRLVTESGQRLYAQGGDFLADTSVGATTYICTDLGADPVFSTIADGSDVELRDGDKLYIHYTPSSANEDGETVNAEPVSIVYEGGDVKNPVIIKPSGFTLTPSDDLNKQGTSWKKTDVDFNGDKKNLLSLAPNEQIEMRSISRVILNTPARFYRNFEAKELDGNVNSVESYELKDGEYIFYTDQNTQEAAYYGSGSVITLDKGAFIPKASEPVEISQILEQGLHIIPWSNWVLLNDDRKITITEYQYVTLVEGDKLNTLTIENGNTISSENADRWKTCDTTLPIEYTPAGAETSTGLPTIALHSGDSTGWEVCSFLELATSPGYAQQLRVTKPSDENSDRDSTVTITNKFKVYIKDSTNKEHSYEIVPQTTVVPTASGDIGQSAPLSIKLDTIAQVASGSFEKKDSDPDDGLDGTKMQMKLFSTEVPALIELTDYNEEFTPISNKHAVPADSTSENLNNYWTKLDIRSSLLRTGIDTTDLLPNALNLNFMIPENADVFGIFSIYLAVPEGKLDPQSKQQMLKGPEAELNTAGCRVFIDIPSEFGTADEVISIYNLDGNWWSEGIDGTNSNRLFLRAGLNCVKVNKSCNIYIKAEEEADGSLLYDNLRLVKGIETNGVNLALLDPDAKFNDEAAFFNAIKEPDQTQIDNFAAKKKQYADKLLAKIAELDRNHDFYYNVPVENSLAIEFDNNINAFSNPYTLYDINNINNSFVVSKLDVADLKNGLKIAKSSRY
jgi:hypothetical protein